MAERGTISQRIALEGAEEIKRMLAEIGQTGEKAFEQVKDAVEKAQSNLAKVSSAVEGVEKQVGKVAAAGRSLVDAITRAGRCDRPVRRGAGDYPTRLGAVSTTAVAVGSSIFALAKSAAGAADEIGKQSQALGITVQSYQRLQFAAAQAGASQQQFAGGMARFSKVVTGGDQGTGCGCTRGGGQLKAMGISLSPAAQAERSVAEAAGTAAKRLAEMNVEVVRGGVSSKQQAEDLRNRQMAWCGLASA